MIYPQEYEKTIFNQSLIIEEHLKTIESLKNSNFDAFKEEEYKQTAIELKNEITRLTNVFLSINYII